MLGFDENVDEMSEIELEIYINKIMGAIIKANGHPDIAPKLVELYNKAYYAKQRLTENATRSTFGSDK